MANKGFLENIFSFFTKSSNVNEENIEVLPKEKLPIATLTIKDFGVIEAELYPHIAPNSVNNFIYLAQNGFYDGLLFHRIVKNFVIQGGCPEGTGVGGPGYTIRGEFDKNGFKNNLKHTEGVLSMARSQSKNSAGSQFFIITKTASYLDKKYASFGKVTNGFDIVKKIESVETGMNDYPTQPVIIESIKIDTKGIEYKEPEKL